MLNPSLAATDKLSKAVVVAHLMAPTCGTMAELEAAVPMLLLKAQDLKDGYKASRGGGSGKRGRAPRTIAVVAGEGGEGSSNSGSGGDAKRAKAGEAEGMETAEAEKMAKGGGGRAHLARTAKGKAVERDGEDEEASDGEDEEASESKGGSESEGSWEFEC